MIPNQTLVSSCFFENNWNARKQAISDHQRLSNN